MTDRASKGGGKATPIEPGMIQRAIQGVRYAVTGKKPENWFGPLEPLPPMAPPDVTGRQFDFPVGFNLRITPRSGEAVSFNDMRQLADACDLLRLVIETRKDQMVKLKWDIKPVDDDTEAEDSRIDEIKDFLRYPDRVHTFQTWTRMILEDLFVIDAPCVYPRKTMGGAMYALEPMDGATIKRVIDSWGRTPMPPGPAYQQILKGLPAVDYTFDELVYFPRNERTNRVYGYSPVEQVIMTVNIILRRELSQLQYYTEGNVPDVFIQVPESWNPDQIAQFQTYWDALLEGNTANRRHAKFIPGGMKIEFTKDIKLKDEYDEWLARVICFCFSISPQAFVKQMNRATADTAQEVALEEGLAPIMQWFKDFMDVLIQRHFGYTDVEFVWKEEKELDPDILSQVNERYVRSGIKSVDEVREDLGLDPVGMDNAIYVATGAVFLDDLINPPETQTPPALPGKKPPQALPPGEEDKGQVAGKLIKRKKKALKPIDRNRKAAVKARDELQKTLEDFFKEARKDIAGQIQKAFEKTAKAEDDEVERILSELNLKGWTTLIDPSERVLERVFKDGGAEAAFQIGIASAPYSPIPQSGPPYVINEDLTNVLNERALDYAKTRAAEMVGMRYTKEGKLVENPNAEYAITDGTRTMLREMVSDAIEEGWSPQKLRDTIDEHTAFGKGRAEMIARTEIANADVQGNMAAYRASNVVDRKEWIVGSEHDDEDECDDNAAQGEIPLDEEFLSGDDAPPAHPRCLVGGTIVSAAGVTKHFKRWFEGEIIILSVPGMNDLSITPNHPVLAEAGWVPAGFLKKGDKLFFCEDAESLFDPQDDHVKTRIEEISNALLMSGGVPAVTVPAPPVAFHGDGAIDGEVDIVRAAGLLMDNVKSLGEKNIVDGPFGIGHGPSGERPADGLPALFLKSDFTASCGLMGGGGTGETLSGSQPGHIDDSTCAHGTDRQTESPKSFSERGTMAPDAAGDITARLAGHIRTVKLSNVVRREFKGHVYNLETKSNYYIAQNLIVHNCVCDVLPVLSEEEGPETGEEEKAV